MPIFRTPAGQRVGGTAGTQLITSLQATVDQGDVSVTVDQGTLTVTVEPEAAEVKV